MNNLKKLISTILLVILLTAVFGINVFADSGIGIEPGQAMPDFTVSLTDGTTAALSEILKEKELVVLNIFASWCGPCEKEFPEMEKVYQSKLAIFLNLAGLPRAVYYILVAAGLLISIPEGLKLAKAFGKGKAFGVLMAFPFFNQIFRFVLGVSKAAYQPPES